MKTLNIQFTDTLYKKILGFVKADGFANKAEFVRFLVRYYELSKEKKKTDKYPDTPKINPSSFNKMIDEKDIPDDLKQDLKKGYKEFVTEIN